MTKKRILFIIGILLILYAVYNIIMLQASETYSNLENENLINQAGFVPLLAAEEEILNDGNTNNNSQTGNQPDRISIPKISLDAPVEVARAVTTIISEKEYIQYLVPEKYAAGYHENSAPLGEIGNTVISGHHNAYGEVFKNLYQLVEGDFINLFSEGKLYQYIITNVMIFEEKDQPLDVRLENARWILPSEDERITLVTCWPQDSNTHRLIIVAVPFSTAQSPSSQEICSQDELIKVNGQFFNEYMKAVYFSEYASEISTDQRQVIMDLYEIQGDVVELDDNYCQSSLKTNLVEYIKTRMLQTSFNQISYQGEEYRELMQLINSYEDILESYFGTYEESTREEILHSFQSSMRFIPSSISTTIVAKNTEEKSLNVREKATADSRFLGSLSSGSSTIVIGKSLDGEWLLIPYKESLGWIKLSYTELNTPIEMIPEVLNQIVAQAEE